MTHRLEPFIYSGDKVPVGGEPGDVLLKVNFPNYYTAWRDLTSVFETYDVVLDDGEY